MTRRAVAMYLGSIVCIAWAVLTVWAFIHGATRRDDDVPEVQPPDPYTFGLSESRWNDGNATVTYTYTSGGSRDWRN